ncbi:MAG TPA: DAK2 domain-containing protein [Candidatus Dormibacteraeota bacterium]
MAAAEATASGAPAVVTGRALRQGLERALRRLAEQRAHINELNVFPVPDGDTGSNMHLTLEAACRELSGLAEDAPVAEVARALAHGALMGARGNSGVILSQVFRGWASATPESDTIDPGQLAAALEEGSRVAYLAVKRPVEGTILSVARDAARAANRALEEGGDLGRLAGAVTAEAWAAVERSRDQLDVLRQAGVVDAGGFGLAVILTAVAERVGGSVADRSDPRSERAPMGAAGAAPMPEEGFGYCTEFVLAGAGLEAAEVRGRLGDDAEDDSALVVGEPGLLHVHLHTMTPWLVLAEAARLGQIQRLKVEDMTDQHRQAARPGEGTEAPAALHPVGVVAVAQGEGFRELLLGLGAAFVVDGGQSQNPSTKELLRGVDLSGSEDCLLLPNNANLVLGAEQAAELAEREVAVVPSRNLPQGIAALLAFDPEAPLEVNRLRMERALDGVHAIEVTRAVRASQLDGRAVEAGALIGILDGRLVSSGAKREGVVLEALAALPKSSIEVVTLYRGAEVEPAASDELAQAIRARFPELEVECHDGGQPLYQFVISAE